MSDQEEDGSSPKGDTWQANALEHVFWFISRLALAVALIIVAYVVRLPLERVIQLAREGQIEERIRTEELDRIERRNKIVKFAREVEARFSDLYLIMLQPAGNSFRAGTINETRRAFDRAEVAVANIRTAYANRSGSLDDDYQDPFNFDIVALRFINIVEAELAEKKEMIAGGPIGSQTFSASQSLMRELLFQLIDRDNELRSRLKKQPRSGLFRSVIG